MFQKVTDPFVVFSVLIYGSLAVSVIVGTIDACLSKGPKATLPMRAGTRDGCLSPLVLDPFQTVKSTPFVCRSCCRRHQLGGFCA